MTAAPAPSAPSASSITPGTPVTGSHPPGPQVITRERHGAWHWRRPPHYGAAGHLAVVPLSSFEVGVAALRLPLAFAKNADRFVLVAVMGIPPATNLCVAPDGQWTGPYIPAVLRAAPFALRAAPDGRMLLCVDEAAAQAGPTDALGAGEPFFASDGTPVPLMKQVLDFLIQLDQGMRTMERACAALHEHGLLAPWKLAFDTGGPPEQASDGLWRVDETALRNLGAEALHSLMQHGALALAYGQLYAVQNITLLADWSRARATAQAKAHVPVAPAPTPPPELGMVQKLFDPSESDTIKFNW